MHTVQRVIISPRVINNDLRYSAAVIALVADTGNNMPDCTALTFKLPGKNGNASRINKELKAKERTVFTKGNDVLADNAVRDEKAVCSHTQKRMPFIRRILSVRIKALPFFEDNSVMPDKMQQRIFRLLVRSGRERPACTDKRLNHRRYITT